MKKNDINLKEVRKQTGFTQQEVADKLGVSLRTYQRYEIDGDGVDYKKLMQISKILGVDMGQITGAVAIGSGNISIKGSDNQINEPHNQKLNTPLYKEFEKLYEEYGNNTMLLSFIEKLKMSAAIDFFGKYGMALVVIAFFVFIYISNVKSERERHKKEYEAIRREEVSRISDGVAGGILAVFTNEDFLQALKDGAYIKIDINVDGSQNIVIAGSHNNIAKE